MLSTLTLLAIFSLSLADDSTMNGHCAASDDTLSLFQSNLALSQRSATRMEQESQRTERACDKSWKCTHEAEGNSGFCGAVYALNTANYAAAGSTDVHVQSFDKGGVLWCKETYSLGGHIHSFERKSATNADEQQVCKSCASLGREEAKVERTSCSLGPHDTDVLTRSHREDCNLCTTGPRKKGDDRCFYCNGGTGGGPRCSGKKNTQCGPPGMNRNYYPNSPYWVSAAGCNVLPSGPVEAPSKCKCLECKCLLEGVADRDYVPDQLPNANDIQPAPACNIQGACSTTEVAANKIIFCKGGTGEDPGPLWAEIVAAREKSSDKAKSEIFGGAYASLSAGSWQTVLVLPHGDIGGWVVGKTTISSRTGEDVTDMKNVATEPDATRQGVCVETTTFTLGCLRGHGLPTKGFFDNVAYLEAEGGGVLESNYFTAKMRATAGEVKWCPVSSETEAWERTMTRAGHAKDIQFLLRVGGMKCYVTAIARATEGERNIQCNPDHATIGSMHSQMIEFDLER